MKTTKYCFSVLFLALFVLGCDDPPTPAPPVHFREKPAIVYFIQGSYDPYWDLVQRGAEEEATKKDVEITWVYPSNNYDSDEQASRLDSLDLKLYNGAIISPIYPSELRASINRLSHANIPVVVADIPMVDDNILGYVDANDYEAGVMAAEEIINRLNGKGNVVMLRNAERCQKTLERERGFRASISGKGNEIKLVSSTLFAGTDDTEKQTMAEFTAMLKNSALPINAVFASNELVGQRVISAMEEIPNSDKICIICCDPSGTLHYQMENGKISALVVSDPQRVGAYAVEMMANYLKGIDTPKKRSVNVMVSDLKFISNPSTQSLMPHDDPFPTPGVPAYDEWPSAIVPD